jgi:integrase
MQINNDVAIDNNSSIDSTIVNSYNNRTEREVQELMGHSSYKTTLQYAHLSEDHANKQVLKLPFANG